MYLDLKALLLTFIFTSFVAVSQNANDFMDEVNKNRVISTLMEFSGEVDVDDIGVILNRSNEVGKNKARKYLINRFRDLNLKVKKDYVTKYGLNGINMIATQPGIMHPDSIVIICGHYDSVDEYCADDNASGVSAVLEVATILSEYNFEKTIIYALWDLEEDGLFGSKDYALQAFKNGDKISAVINTDMIGYDGDNDMLFELHFRYLYEDDIFYTVTESILDKSSLSLTPEYVSFGTNRSDHASFWNYNFPSVLFTEGFESNDFNPNYHTSFDRVEGISTDYLIEITKLLVGVTSEFAVVSKETLVHDKIKVENIYYNPITESLTMKNTNIQDFKNIEIFDISGKSITIEKFNKDNNSISLSELISGVYFIKINDRAKSISKFIKY